MTAFKDLSGKIIGNRTVLIRGPNSGTSTRWVCRCDCGTERLVRAAHLASGASTNCGCKAIGRVVSHGEAVRGRFSKKYRTWRQIKARCCNPNHKNADIYYGLLCESWYSYEAFAQYMPDPPSENHEIDRIDNAIGYEPGNVRWATRAEQIKNRAVTRWIEYNGERKTLTEWAKFYDVAVSTMHERIRKWNAPTNL